MLTDGLNLNEVGNEFVGNKEVRMRLFGKFKFFGAFFYFTILVAIHNASYYILPSITSLVWTVPHKISLLWPCYGCPYSISTTVYLTIKYTKIIYKILQRNATKVH